jgi:hypothetical protein
VLKDKNALDAMAVTGTPLLNLDREAAFTLQSVVERDVCFLAGEGVMDYSLLVGVERSPNIDGSGWIDDDAIGDISDCNSDVDTGNVERDGDGESSGVRWVPRAFVKRKHYRFVK